MIVKNQIKFFLRALQRTYLACGQILLQEALQVVEWLFNSPFSPQLFKVHCYMVNATFIDLVCSLWHPWLSAKGHINKMLYRHHLFLVTFFKCVIAIPYKVRQFI